MESRLFWIANFRLATSVGYGGLGGVATPVPPPHIHTL
jgi:hypothetical protein